MNLLDLLSAGGDVLDTPGRLVRTGLAGKNPLDALLDPSQGVSGRQLLEQYGLVGANEDQGWVPDAGDVGGFAAEMVLDPTNWLGGGLLAKPLGKASKAKQLNRTAVPLMERIFALRGQMIDDAISAPRTLRSLETPLSQSGSVIARAPRTAIEERFLSDNAARTRPIAGYLPYHENPALNAADIAATNRRDPLPAYFPGEQQRVGVRVTGGWSPSDSNQWQPPGDAWWEHGPHIPSGEANSAGVARTVDEPGVSEIDTWFGSKVDAPSQNFVARLPASGASEALTRAARIYPWASQIEYLGKNVPLATTLTEKTTKPFVSVEQLTRQLKALLRETDVPRQPPLDWAAIEHSLPQLPPGLREQHVDYAKPAALLAALLGHNVTSRLGSQRN
jgi:hypothetical protein